MTRRWLSRLVERRRARNADPFTAEEMAGFRCRVWRLVKAGRS